MTGRGTSSDSYINSKHLFAPVHNLPPSCSPTPSTSSPAALVAPHCSIDNWRCCTHKLSRNHTGIVDSGELHIYFDPDAPITNLDPSAPPVHAGTATGSVQRYRGTAEIALPSLPTDIPKHVQVMPYFAHNLVGIGSFCDDDCTVTFDKDAVNIAGPAGRPIITSCSESKGACLRRITLVHQEDPEPPIVPGKDADQELIDAFSAYELPSSESLVFYFHAAAGFPASNTWLKAIKLGNYEPRTGITYQNVTKY